VVYYFNNFTFIGILLTMSDSTIDFIRKLNDFCCDLGLQFECFVTRRYIFSDGCAVEIIAISGIPLSIGPTVTEKCDEQESSRMFLFDLQLAFRDMCYSSDILGIYRGRCAPDRGGWYGTKRGAEEAGLLSRNHLIEEAASSCEPQCPLLTLRDAPNDFIRRLSEFLRDLGLQCECFITRHYMFPDARAVELIAISATPLSFDPTIREACADQGSSQRFLHDLQLAFQRMVRSNDIFGTSRGRFATGRSSMFGSKRSTDDIVADISSEKK